MTFVLEGPGARCRTAAVFRVAGHRGVNQVPLTAIVRRQKIAAGTYRLVPQRPARGKPVGIYISTAGRVSPVQPPRKQSCPQSGATAANATAAGFAGAKIGGISGGRVALPRTATGVRGGKIAKSALVFAQSPTSVLRFLTIVIGVLLALTIPVVFVAAAWRDLHRT